MDLTGRVIAIMPAQSGVSQRTGNAWMTQEMVLEVPGQYPKKCVFRIQGQARIQQFNIQMGETITISFDIDAHEFNGRWYTEITCYNVVHATQTQYAPNPAPQYQQPAPQYQQQPAPAPAYQQPAPAPAPQYQQQPAPFPQQPAPAPTATQQPAPQAQQAPLPFPPAQ